MSTTISDQESREKAAKHAAAERPALEFGAAWDYAPAPESREHVRLEERYGLFIGGRFVPPRSRKHFATINPATEEELADVAEAGAADVDAAVRSAEEAYRKRWSRLPPAERGKYLYRIARLLQEKSREFAVLESVNGGKPIKESRDVDIRWQSPISSTTRAGPTSSPTPSPGTGSPRSASAARSSRGISRCSWRPGSWPRPWPAETRSS